MLVKVGGKSLEIKNCNFFQRIIGLMFTRRENAEALLFDFVKPTKLSIHSFFVFFPFLAIWLDVNGKIVEKRIIPSWKLSTKPKKEFSKLIEIPFNRRYFKIIQKFS